MQHFTLQIIIIAMTAVTLSWLWQLSGAYKTVIKRENDIFNWGFYFRKNFIEIFIAYLSVFLLLFLLQKGMDLIGLSDQWSDLLAFGCGIFNVQLVKFLKNLGDAEIEKRTGKKIDDSKTE